MVKDPVVLHHECFCRQLFQYTFRHTFREKVPLTHRFPILPAAVIEHPPHDMHGRFLIPLQKSQLILFPVFCCNPYPRLHIGN